MSLQYIGDTVANYRNGLANKPIRTRIETDISETGVNEFGALIGDRVRIGTNAVVAWERKLEIVR